MNKHDKPSAESVGNDDRRESNLDIGTTAIRPTLVTEVVELVVKYHDQIVKYHDQYQQELREGTPPEDLEPFTRDP